MVATIAFTMPVAMSSELFEKREGLDAQRSFEAKIQEAEADTKAGHIRPMTDAQRDMRAKYGL